MATQGRTGPLPCMRPMRGQALPRSPLLGLPGGSRHLRACSAALSGPDEDPLQIAGHHRAQPGGRARRLHRGGSGVRSQVPPEPIGYASLEAEGTTTTTTTTAPM